MSTIFSLFSTLNLKQQTSILRCFPSLKFENSLFSNKLFRPIFGGKRNVYTAENNQSIFLKSDSLKQHFLFLQTTSWLCCHCHKLRFFKFVESFKGLLHHSGNCLFFICIRLWTTTTSDRIHPLNIRKREPYKNLKILT